MFVWDQMHSVGNGEIDRQHAHIVELINMLAVAASSGHGQATLDSVLHHLQRYMNLHFRSEEKLMAAIRVPELKAHATEHQQCLTQIESFVAAAHINELDLHGAVAYLGEWLLTHTLSSDRSYIPYVEGAPEIAREWEKEARERVQDPGTPEILVAG